LGSQVSRKVGKLGKAPRLRGLKKGDHLPYISRKQEGMERVFANLKRKKTGGLRTPNAGRSQTIKKKMLQRVCVGVTYWYGLLEPARSKGCKKSEKAKRDGRQRRDGDGDHHHVKRLWGL